MISMIVGTAILKKGVEYSGLVPSGNAFRVMDNSRRASVNRESFVLMPQNEDIYTTPDITYTFEEDTAVLLTRVTDPTLNIIYEASSKNVIDLIKDTESAVVVTVEAVEAVTTGSFSYQVAIENTKASSRDVTVRAYNGTTLLRTDTYTVLKKRIDIFSTEHTLINAIAAGDNLHFTVEVNNTGCLIKGTHAASRIQITRKT